MASIYRTLPSAQITDSTQHGSITFREQLYTIYRLKLNYMVYLIVSLYRKMVWERNGNLGLHDPI